MQTKTAPTFSESFDFPSADARPFALQECRRAVKLLREEQARLADAKAKSDVRPEGRSIDEDRAWYCWDGILETAVRQAERRVVTCILAMNCRDGFDTRSIEDLEDKSPAALALGHDHLCVAWVDGNSDREAGWRLFTVTNGNFDAEDYGVGPASEGYGDD